MTSILKFLKIPYNKTISNLPISHYEALVEQKGYQPIHNALIELLVFYRDDKKLSEKVRTLISILDKQFLFEKKKTDSEVCVCGFKTLGEEYEKCPCCNTMLHDNKRCFYINDDHSCSQDGEDCNCIDRKQCNKN